MTQNDETEEARARGAAVAMTALVDVRDWDGVQSYFAPQVTVDYTSLFPGKVETIPRETLIQRWKALVPGFDATRHILTDVEVDVQGTKASGTARIAATHFLGADRWTPYGHYKYAFQKSGGNWKISALTYLSEREEGDRSLVERATARAREQR